MISLYMLREIIFNCLFSHSILIVSSRHDSPRDTNVMFRDAKCPPGGVRLLQEEYDKVKVDKKEISHLDV